MQKRILCGKMIIHTIYCVPIHSKTVWESPVEVDVADTIKIKNHSEKIAGHNHKITFQPNFQQKSSSPTTLSNPRGELLAVTAFKVVCAFNTAIDLSNAPRIMSLRLLEIILHTKERKVRLRSVWNQKKTRPLNLVIYIYML